jgi:hypothetical protein
MSAKKNAEQQRKTLRKRLIAGYQANATADAAIASEWVVLEDEAWHNQHIFIVYLSSAHLDATVDKRR